MQLLYLLGEDSLHHKSHEIKIGEVIIYGVFKNFSYGIVSVFSSVLLLLFIFLAKTYPQFQTCFGKNPKQSVSKCNHALVGFWLPQCKCVDVVHFGMSHEWRWLSSSTSGFSLSKGRALFLSNKHFFIRAHGLSSRCGCGCTQLGETAAPPQFNVIKID